MSIRKKKSNTDLTGVTINKLPYVPPKDVGFQDSRYISGKKKSIRSALRMRRIRGFIHASKQKMVNRIAKELEEE